MCLTSPYVMESSSSHQQTDKQCICLTWAFPFEIGKPRFHCLLENGQCLMDSLNDFTRQPHGIFHHPYVLDLQPAPTLICTTLAGAPLGTALCWDPRALSVIHQLRAKHAGIHHYHPLVFFPSSTFGSKIPLQQ